MPAPEYHDQLLALAEELIAGRPNRAKLCRAVSSAYYALFHLLVGKAVKLLRVDPSLRAVAGRALDHSAMRQGANQVAGGTIPAAVARGFSGPVPAELKQVAAVFVKQQGLRHEADYNTARRFTRSEVQGYVTEVKEAFANWRSVADQPAAKAFLLALPLHKLLDRRPV